MFVKKVVLMKFSKKRRDYVSYDCVGRTIIQVTKCKEDVELNEAMLEGFWD